MQGSLRCVSGEIECHRVTNNRLYECARTSAHTTVLIVCGGGRIRLGVANQNLLSAKIISMKFCKRPIRENFVPRKFGAIWHAIQV